MAENGQYQVDENIPMPPRKRGSGRKSRYPFEQLEVGQSFLVTDRKYASIGSTVARRNKQGEPKFAARTVNDGVRVWRTA